VTNATGKRSPFHNCLQSINPFSPLPESSAIFFLISGSENFLALFSLLFAFFAIHMFFRPPDIPHLQPILHTFSHPSHNSRFVMSSTLPLTSSLGWIDLVGRPTRLNPIITFCEGSGLSSDLLHALTISHLLLNHHTVCVIGSKYPFSHIAPIVKKVGQINLDQYLKSGQLLYIDCLTQSYQQLDTLVKPSLDLDNSSLTPLPATSYPILFSRIQTAHQLHSNRASPLSHSSTSSAPSPRSFSICFDDLSLLHTLNQASSTTTIDFLTSLLQFTHQPLFHLLNSANHQINESDEPTGTLSFALSTSLSQSASSPQTPSTLFKPASSVSLLFPNQNVNVSELDSRKHTMFDIPVIHGSDTAQIIHWVKDLNYLLFQTSPPNTVNQTVMIIELSSLSSGYSKDIYCQLSLLTPSNVFNGSQSTSPKLSISKSLINILYLIVGNDGTLICHSRA